MWTIPVVLCNVWWWLCYVSCIFIVMIFQFIVTRALGRFHRPVRGCDTLEHALFRSEKSMHMLHDPSCFRTIIGLAIQVGKIAFLKIPTFFSLATSVLIALLRSPPWTLFFCLTSFVPGLIMSLCSMTSLSTHTMFVRVQAKTCLYLFKSVTSEKFNKFKTFQNNPFSNISVTKLFFFQKII